MPKILVDGEEFRGLSEEAIILYSMLLKRTGMSFKNNWIDKEGRVLIYFTVEEIMKRRNISKPIAIRSLDELDVKKGIGQIRTSIDDNGKEHTNIRILSSKLLKAKEQMKGQEEKKESVLGAIKNYQAEDKEKSKEKKEVNKEAER